MAFERENETKRNEPGGADLLLFFFLSPFLFLSFFCFVLGFGGGKGGNTKEVRWSGGE